MKPALLVTLLLLCASLLPAQTDIADAAVRGILDEQVTNWNKGDATGYSRHFAEDGTFTNVQGQFFVGHKEFLDRHEAIFKSIFRGTVLKAEVVSLKFLGHDVVVAETLSTVSEFSKVGPPPPLPSTAKDSCIPACCKSSPKRATNGRSWHTTTSR